MNERPHTKYSIRELVQASGVPRRTVRYYVQRGLLPAPEGAGRGHFYRAEHLDRLMRIKELQGRGMGLDEIGARLEGPPAEDLPVPEIELATRIHIADGVELLISHGRETPRPAELRALALAAARILNEGGR
jgi:DNA-binding transcriptional MerR regulator